MTDKKYVLDDLGNPVEEIDLVVWAKWFESANRHLAKDELPGGIRVSTVFLGMDHNWGEGPPLLWETMIFGGPNDSYQDRYSTREAALEGHKRALQLAQGGAL